MKNAGDFLFSKKYRKIFIKDYVTSIVIGAYQEEKLQPQKIRLNVEAWVINKASKDSIKRVVNYDAMIAATKEVLSKEFSLMEGLAEELSDKLVKQKGICAVRVRVEKLTLVADAQSVGVEIFKAK